MKTRISISAAIILAVLIIDQVIKIYVKTNMHILERIYVTDWFQLLFVENNGMAFGWEIGEKIFLTLFRIIAVSFIGWYIFTAIKSKAQIAYIACLSLVLAGAAGNIFDCLFYGMIFNDPEAPFVAEYVGWGNGYSDFLTGKVVDMFYFPLIEWDMPEWMPVYSGEHCIFFSPIFNFADAAISCGVIALILFFPHTLSESLKKTNQKNE